MQGKHKSKKESRRSKSKKTSSYSSSSEEEWVEKKVVPSEDISKKGDCSRDCGTDRSVKNEVSKVQTREIWMNLPSTFLSDSNLDRRKNREEQRKKESERQQYNPRECSRELNPYWKGGGDGLPKFQKPSSFEQYHQDTVTRNSVQNTNNMTSNWKKKKEDKYQQKVSECVIESITEPTVEKHLKETVTEKDLNLLGAKIVKAEIMGNTKLVTELKEKLDQARKMLNKFENTKITEDIILTHTDTQGRSQPVKLNSTEDHITHKRKKTIETHKDGSRVKYFADDDKYSLNQMFENEKYNTVEDSNKEFLNMTKKVRRHEDLDDIFSDNIRKKESDSKTDSKTRDKAISQHQQISNSLNNCNKCIQSEYMSKHLLVSLCETVYLGLPAYEPLAEGHCIISPIRHTPCSTQLDENEWSDILNVRKALVRMFQSSGKDVIFFEYATSLHKFPHMSIECVPLSKEAGDMAPIYFKKAIDECETEWTQNKKLISLKGRDVRKAIPKGLSYFFVSFGLEEGYAHVIEDEELFPKNFAQEIIGGMLDIHHSKWRKPKRQSFEEQSSRMLVFTKIWKDFDFKF